MTVFGISMMRDEADIAATVVDHMLRQVDAVIVADNRSQDGTREILETLQIEVIDDPEPGYLQSEKMTRLAALAAERGATWVVPFDADEIWYSPFGRIGDVLEAIPPQWLVAEALLYDHVATGVDPDELDPVRRIGWRRRAPGGLPKVACRTRPDLTILQGNHGASYEGGPTELPGQLVVRHFPYRSAEQFVRKARNGAEAYAATDLPVTAGAHWRGYGQILKDSGEEALADVFREWFWIAEPEGREDVIFDPAPAWV
jgi:glycosyltransferase involved in cell wall biosynthesis